MRNFSKMQKKKEGGFVLTSELVLIVTILVIGMTVGLVSMRDAITAEMHDVAEAIGALDQSYAFNGLENVQATAGIEGSAFNDATDTLAGDQVGWDFTAVTTGEEGLAAPAGPSPGQDSGTPGTIAVN